MVHFAYIFFMYIFNGNFHSFRWCQHVSRLTLVSNTTARRIQRYSRPCISSWGFPRWRPRWSWRAGPCRPLRFASHFDSASGTLPKAHSRTQKRKKRKIRTKKTQCSHDIMPECSIKRIRKFVNCYICLVNFPYGSNNSEKTIILLTDADESKSFPKYSSTRIGL